MTNEIKVKVIAIGNSSGIIIPKETLLWESIEQGDEIRIEIDRHRIDKSGREKYKRDKEDRKKRRRR